MFWWALCAHHQKVNIDLYSILYHHTCRWPSGAQDERGLSTCRWPSIAQVERELSQPVHQTATYRCDDTRCCIIHFWPPDNEQTAPETCRGIQYTYYKTRNCALSWLITKIIKLHITTLLEQEATEIIFHYTFMFTKFLLVHRSFVTTVSQLYREVNSVKKHNYKIWLNDSVY